MPITKSRQISKLIDLNGKLKDEFTDSDFVIVSGRLGIVAPSGMKVVSSADTLPVTATNGDQAFVTSTNRLYAYSGAGWYNIGLINSSPYWITEPDSDYTLELISIDSDVKIIVLAGDSDNTPLTYIATVDSDFNVAATITHDSDKDNVWVIRRRDSESGAGTTGDVTFKASDGVNLVTFVSTFTISSNAAAYSTMGSNYGYVSGGFGPSGPGQPNVYIDTIQKYSFTSDANATDVGNLTGNRGQVSTGQSGTHAIIAAGRTAPSASYTNQIQSYPFASDGNATDTGHDASAAWSNGSSQGHPVGNGTKTYFMYQTQSYSYNFASNTAAAATISPTADTNQWGGHSSSDTNGYVAGWRYYGGAWVASNTILRFPFSADSTTVDVGNLNAAKYNSSGANSSTHGYAAGGTFGTPQPYSTGGHQNTIYKWSFASDGNSSDIGNLQEYNPGGAGGSSTSHGYVAGGGPGTRNTIEKWPFASNANTTDIADLFHASWDAGGHNN
jgi:hypothetical protein